MGNIEKAAAVLLQHRNAKHLGKSTLDETCPECIRLMQETLANLGINTEDLRAAVKGGIEVPRFVAPLVKYLLAAETEDAWTPPPLTNGVETQVLMKETFAHSAAAHGHDRPEIGCQECTRLANALFTSMGGSPELLVAALEAGMEVPSNLLPFVAVLVGTNNESDDVWKM